MSAFLTDPRSAQEIPASQGLRLGQGTWFWSMIHAGKSAGSFWERLPCSSKETEGHFTWHKTGVRSVIRFTNIPWCVCPISFMHSSVNGRVVVFTSWLSWITWRRTKARRYLLKILISILLDKFKVVGVLDCCHYAKWTERVTEGRAP